MNGELNGNYIIMGFWGTFSVLFGQYFMRYFIIHWSSGRKDGMDMVMVNFASKKNNNSFNHNALIFHIH
jgi:hypothetical protein